MLGDMQSALAFSVPALAPAADPGADDAREVSRETRTPVRLQTLQRIARCDGSGVALLIGRPADEPPVSHPDLRALELALTRLVGAGRPGGTLVAGDLTVVLRHAAAADEAWLIPALRWVAGRGQPCVIRASAALSVALIDAAAAAGAGVTLEIAHGRAGVQRALLGVHAASGGALLAAAPALRRAGVPVDVRLGPLSAELSDGDLRQGPEAVLEHIELAGIRRVHVVAAELTEAARARVLGQLPAVRPWADRMQSARSPSSGSPARELPTRDGAHSRAGGVEVDEWATQLAERLHQPRRAATPASARAAVKLLNALRDRVLSRAASQGLRDGACECGLGCPAASAELRRTQGASSGPGSPVPAPSAADHSLPLFERTSPAA
jgi:hypothetical protein